jgi:hypothetical protein
MSQNKKPVEVIFAPGAFDSFEGTQQELDELVAQIQQMAESGELTEKSRALSEEEAQELLGELDIDVTEELPRNLQ